MLKRKRDGRDVDEVAEGTETLERQVKKLKVSNDYEVGHRIRGNANANARKRPERMTAADGMNARARRSLRRMLFRERDANRGRF
jgi:hypothetical protein